MVPSLVHRWSTLEVRYIDRTGINRDIIGSVGRGVSGGSGISGASVGGGVSVASAGVGRGVRYGREMGVDADERWGLT